MTEKQYRKHPAISQSKLGWLDQHPKYYRHKIHSRVKDEADHFRIGSAVDCLLTDPGSWKETFYVIKDYTPSGMMKSLCDKFVELTIYSELDETQCFKEAYVYSDYKQPEKTVFKNFRVKKVQDYIKDRIASQGKTCLSADEERQIKSIVRLLQFSEHTKDYFNQKSTDKKEFHYQKALLFKAEGYDCKGLLDLLIIDHENKVVSPVDLKTIGKSVYSFSKSFIKWGYYIQAAFYTEAVRQYMNESAMLTGKDISDYKLENFKFIVCEKSTYNAPFIYQCTDNDLIVGEFGGEHKEYARKFKGYRQLLQNLAWHEEQNYWEMPREDIQQNFTFELDVFKQKEVEQNE
jgi:hypothetical protein